MIKKFDTYNESIRDKMTPKSQEEIMKLLLIQSEKAALIKSIEFNMLDPFNEILLKMNDTITKKQLQNLLKAAKFYNSENIIKFLTDKLKNEKLDESIRDLMTAKSKEEIEDAYMVILNKIKPTPIVEVGGDDKSDIGDICKLMDSNIDDLYLLVDDNDDDDFIIMFELFESLVIGKEAGKNLKKIDRYEYNYSIYKDIKMVFGTP